MLRLDLSDQEARKLFKDMDADDGGFIEFDECCPGLLSPCSPIQPSCRPPHDKGISPQTEEMNRGQGC
jgi:hypothetical protein